MYAKDLSAFVSAKTKNALEDRLLEIKRAIMGWFCVEPHLANVSSLRQQLFKQRNFSRALGDQLKMQAQPDADERRQQCSR